MQVFLSLDVLAWLKGMELGRGEARGCRSLVLLLTMLLAGLGLSLFVAHVFIFYFAVASVITPPGALAAFVAETIIEAESVATAVSAVQSGIVMFVVPFIFCLSPRIAVYP